MRRKGFWIQAKLQILVVIICLGATGASAAAPPPTSPHVVVVVWDGMRPDMINERNCPVLWRLAQQGVVFRNHHSVYPTATVVNGTAIATGSYPAHSGIIANHDYYPGIDVARAVDVETLAVVRKGDQLSGGNYLGQATLAEMIQGAGKKTAVSAAKGIGLLFDRHAGWQRSDCVNAFEGHVLPATAAETVAKIAGPFSELKQRHFARSDEWAVRTLIDVLWKDEIPAFSLLWLSEPDGSQHFTAPGSPAALAAIKGSDANLERVLAALDRHHVRDRTDVFVVSDHGFSTIARSIDLRKILRDAGFDAASEFAGEPRPGQILLAGNGGSVLFYVIGRDPTVTQRLVDFLEQSDFAGVIFTRDKLEGTFPLEAAKIDNQRMPDVVMSFRWQETKNQFGVAGMIDADWNRKPGEATHATLSRFDVHNILIAAGPHFRRGQATDLPSGNVDLAPTILHIFGISPAGPFDGRVLSEALANEQTAQLQPETGMMSASKRFPSGIWQQSFQGSRVGQTFYIDQGNGKFVPKD